MTALPISTRAHPDGAADPGADRAPAESARTAPRPVTATERARLRSDVAVAAAVVAPQWPLRTVIAVNPLGGLEDLPFGAAIATAGELFGARGTLPESVFRAEYARGRITEADLRTALHRRHPGAAAAEVVVDGRRLPGADLVLADLLHGSPAPAPVRRLRTLAELFAPAAADLVDHQVSTFCAVFLDDGLAGWPLPGRSAGLVPAWRRLAERDQALPRGARALLRHLPTTADDLALAALDLLGLGSLGGGGDRPHYLRAHLTRLPGWAGAVRQRAEEVGDVDLTDFLAVRLALEAALLADHPAVALGLATWRLPQPLPEPVTAQARATEVLAALGLGPGTGQEARAVAGVLAEVPVADRALVWQEAYEGHYRDHLLALLDRPRPAPSAVRPDAQVVCCIDVRSEGLRRHLERLGAYETLGFAGFFALAVSFQDLAGGAPTAQCPVLVRPHSAALERPAPGAAGAAARRVRGLGVVARADSAFHAAKDTLLGPFALAEAGGWVAGPLAAGKTLVPSTTAAVRRALAERLVPEAPTTVETGAGFGQDEQVAFAVTALRMMGLTRGFGRIVLLCGHGAGTENNPFASALDCGACGGNPGGPNARAAVQVLNEPAVRTGLATAGIVVPADTWFVAAEHDTTTDTVQVLDRHLVPEGHRADLAALEADLDRAGDLLAAERCGSLPGAPREPSPRRARRHVRARAVDWAQVYPEWGLAGNAAFVVGPRSLTAGADLGRRVFLHSYEAAADPDGTALETILTAPLVVAQWIACQYYFSTVDPAAFGSGTKTVHNVAGGVGVLAGPGGDLRRGLPLQSVSGGSGPATAAGDGGTGDGVVAGHEPLRLLAVVQAPPTRIEAIVERNPVLQRLFGNAWVALAARAADGEAWQRFTQAGWAPWQEGAL